MNSTAAIPPDARDSSATKQATTSDCADVQVDGVTIISVGQLVGAASAVPSEKQYSASNIYIYIYIW